MRALGIQGGGIARILSQLGETEDRIGELSDEISSLTEEYAEALREVGVCPFCGTRIDSKDVQGIRKHAEGSC